MAMDRDDELPTTTLPKLTDVGFNARTPKDEPEPVPPELPEENVPVVPHPVIAMIESEAASRKIVGTGRESRNIWPPEGLVLLPFARRTVIQQGKDRSLARLYSGRLKVCRLRLD
jgi:hypothetical protein